MSSSSHTDSSLEDATLHDAVKGYLHAMLDEGTTQITLPQDTVNGLRNYRQRVYDPNADTPAAAVVKEEKSKPEVSSSTPTKHLQETGEKPPTTRVTPSAKPKAPVSIPSNLDAAGKESALENLKERVMPCIQCQHLADSRTHVVFGVGSVDAKLMFVGEAPGADEDQQGEPFVGAAGQLLTKMIQAMGLSREEVYIANVLKCRPDMPKGSTGNRKPTVSEMATCLPYLEEQIQIISPQVIIALGNTALEGLIGGGRRVSGLRGKWQDFRGRALMPTYHPAYLLRNQQVTERRKVWEDLLSAMEKLELPISDAQRGYFLKGPKQGGSQGRRR